MNKSNYKKIKYVAAIAFVAVLSSCTDSEKNKLDNRVLDYWNFKINKNFEAAYDFLSPGWKSNEDKEAYSRRMGNSRVEWKGVKLIDKECSETYLCSVSVEIKYEYMFGDTKGAKMIVPSTLKENWLMHENMWYYVPLKTVQKSKL